MRKIRPPETATEKELRSWVHHIFPDSGPIVLNKHVGARRTIVERRFVPYNCYGLAPFVGNPLRETAIYEWKVYQADDEPNTFFSQPAKLLWADRRGGRLIPRG